MKFSPIVSNRNTVAEAMVMNHWWFLHRYLAHGFLLIWLADRDTRVINSFWWKTGTAKVSRKRIKRPKIFIFGDVLYGIIFPINLLMVRSIQLAFKRWPDLKVKPRVHLSFPSTGEKSESWWFQKTLRDSLTKITEDLT